MVSEVSSQKAVRLKDFRYPGEMMSVVLTLTGLILVFVAAILFFPKSSSQVINAVLVTCGGLFVYVITVVIQQRSVFGTLVRVSPRQFPEIWEIATAAEERLSSPPVPVCVKRSSEQNIYTLGFWGQPVIVITSQMIDQMPSESLKFFIGRELGRIRAGHTWLRTLLHPLGGAIPIIGPLLDSVVFGDWMNRSEYTADRAGFIACNSLTTSVISMIKYSVGINLFEKLDIREFLEQINDVKSMGSRVTEIVADQPYLVQRVQLLVRFALAHEFNNVPVSERQNTGILGKLPENYLNSALRQAVKSASSEPLPEPEDVIPVTVSDGISAEVNAFDAGLLLTNSKNGQAFKLRRVSTKIGRNLDNDIILNDDDQISRYHAQIWRRDGKFVIIDSGSRNGVWVNSRKIDRESEIYPNDRVRMGREEYVFSIRK